jgi:hypothetical protein
LQTVLLRQQLLDRRLVQHGHHELARDIAVNQPVAVLRKRRRVPHGRVHLPPDKPAEQQIVFELLHELSLRTDRIEGLQQQCPQQFLGWVDGRPVWE